KTAQEPSRGQQQLSYDARGRLTSEILPDNSTQSHTYDAAGSKTGLTDPTNEATSTATDYIGRPTQITYKDNTTQIIKYDGARLLAAKDRQGRWQSVDYAARRHMDGR